MAETKAKAPSIPLPPNPLPAGSYNTYIGARYVPVIGGEWDRTKTYEPLTIVIHEGNSYTSRTYVPAGVAITDETYWTQTGSYNAQYEQIYNQVNVNMGNINTLTGEVARVENETNTKINANSARIDDINSPRKVLAMGDSFANGVTNGGESPNVTPWTYYFQTSARIADSDFMKIGTNSGAFAATADTLRFAKILEANLTAIKAKWGDQPKLDIVVAAGANEILYDYTSIVQGIVEFTQIARANFNDVRMFIGDIAAGYDSSTKYYDVTYAAYTGACLNNGVRYLHGVENIQYMRPKEFHDQSDGVHPNQTGYIWLGWGVAEAYLSGSCSVVAPTVTGTLRRISPFTTAGNITIERANNFTVLTSPQWTINGPTVTFQCTGADWHECATVNPGPFSLLPSMTFSVPGVCQLSQGDFVECTYNFKFTNNKISVAIMSVGPSGWRSGTLTSGYTGSIYVTAMTATT